MMSEVFRLVCKIRCEVRDLASQIAPAVDARGLHAQLAALHADLSAAGTEREAQVPAEACCRPSLRVVFVRCAHLHGFSAVFTFV